MKNKATLIKHIIQEHAQSQPEKNASDIGQAFAPSNIALCKYWGKRNSELNLPVTSSLSISLADKGAHTQIQQHHCDEFWLNNQLVSPEENFHKRLVSFLDLFRPTPDSYYLVKSTMNLPVAAGLASSACGLAAVVLALNNLYGWQLPLRYLSILARIGSGSASRSLWHGFVEWHAGQQDDGLDSYAEPINCEWPEFRIGLHLLHSQQKPISSREAMQRTVKTSTLYQSWEQQVSQDLSRLRSAILAKDFTTVGETAEHNALSMHATMLSSWPPIQYCKPDTLAAMQNVWELRQQGVPVYFTQDAGPNLKLLFLASAQEQILAQFPQLEIIVPFDTSIIKFDK